MSIDFAGLVAQTNLPELVSRYVPLKPRGCEFVGLCPFHSETNPSFVVGEHRGRARFRCWSCGEAGNALDFLMRYHGIEVVEAAKMLNGGDDLPPANIAPRVLLKAPPRITTKPPTSLDAPDCIRRDGKVPVSLHHYLDGTSELLGIAAFYEDSPEPLYWTYGSRGEGDVTKWAEAPFSVPRPLYGAEGLARHPEWQVIVVEGEVVADAAAVLFPDFVCCTFAGGRFGVEGADWSALTGRRVVLIPTADDAGREAMKQAAGLLWAAGVVEIKGIEVDQIPFDGSPDAPLMEAPHGWTIADANGWTPDVALAWAIANRTVYANPSNPAPEGAAPFVPSPPFEAPAESPPVDTPPPVAGPDAAGEALASVASIRSDPPELGVVEGNTVRKPKRTPKIEPEIDLPPEYSEFGLADALVEAIGEDWRCVPSRGVWYRWNGAVWQEDEKESLHYIAKGVLTERQARGVDLSGTQRTRICSDKTVNSVKHLAGRYPKIAVAMQDWDTDPLLLGTPGGVVDLRTGRLCAASREQLISKSTSVAPEEGPTPLFDRVMSHASRGNADIQAYLWRWLGYLLTGDVSEEKFLFLHGEGGSGKSTLVNLAADILGGYAVACKPGMFKEVKHEGHAEEIARLVGCRLAHASETEEGARFNESRIKWLTGRDKLSARFMRENSFEFVATHKIVIHGNHKPGLKSVGQEMRRRICLIEWPALPEEERDSKLKDKLRAEHPAVLARMVRACLDWQAYSLGAPDEVTQATDGYLRAEDTIGAWCDDCIEAGGELTALSGEAYKSYRAWVETEGEHYTLSHKRFSQRLQDRGYGLVKRGGVKLFEGFRLLAIAAPSQPRSYTD